MFQIQKAETLIDIRKMFLPPDGPFLDTQFINFRKNVRLGHFNFGQHNIFTLVRQTHRQINRK